jgi:plastocyanin
VRRIALAVAALVLIGACTTGATSGDAAYELKEFSILGPEALQSSPGAVQVTNTGDYAHTLVVTTEMGEVIAATTLVQPGETISLDLDLDPGTYRFTCRIVAEADGVLVDHFEAGMNRVIEVVG